jgi:hypothetical protein
MVAPPVTRSKSGPARLCQLQRHVGQLAAGVADLLVLASALFAITKRSPATPLEHLLSAPEASPATIVPTTPRCPSRDGCVRARTGRRDHSVLDAFRWCPPPLTVAPRGLSWRRAADFAAGCGVTMQWLARAFTSLHDEPRGRTRQPRCASPTRHAQSQVCPTDLALSCRAAFATEPAVPLTAGGQVSMVAPPVTRSKSRSARPCQLQRHVGQRLRERVPSR